MPKLVLLAPCEKALIGADNAFSMINVIHSVMIISHEATEEIDDAALKSDARKEWTVVSVWQREAGDGGKRFEQRLTLTDPSGNVRMQGIAEFEMSKDFHRLLGKIPGFPPQPIEGEYSIAMAVRPAGDPKQEWVTKGQYPLAVHIRRIRQDRSVSATPNTPPH